MFGWRRPAGTGRRVRYPALPLGAGLFSCRVFDGAAKPLAAADVELSDEHGRRAVRGTSDQFGTFVAAVRPGRYRAAVMADGFQPHRTEVVLAAGNHTALGDLLLQARPELPPPVPGIWQLDPEHTAVRFAARHIGLGRVHGRFTSFSGEIHVAPRIEDTVLQVVIDAASIDTGVQQRDEHLRSADFLQVERFPTLEFTSSRLVHQHADRWTIHGALTLRGVTRTVALDTRYLGTGTGVGGEERAACLAVTELHREDFTLNWRQTVAQVAIVGSSVDIELDIQAVRVA